MTAGQFAVKFAVWLKLLTGLVYEHGVVFP